MGTECSHFWRAVNTRSSQCSICGEIVRSPCREPDCEAAQSELQRAREALIEECMASTYVSRTEAEHWYKLKIARTG